MLRNSILWLSLCFFLISCVTEPKSGKAENQQVSNKKPTTEAAQRLYANYHQDPQTQAQRDENVLIDYAIDKGLDPQKTASGLYYILKEEGTGIVLKHNEPFKANYKGYFLDGKVFDSSYKNGQPIRHTVGGMIPGWNEALKTFKIGSKLQLLIPSRLAYGPRGFPGLIPPNTPLVFDMHIMPLTE